MLTVLSYSNRSPELQEQLWEVSVNKVKDWVTPEILEKYGARMDVTPPTDDTPVTLPTDETPPTDDTLVTPPIDVTPPTNETAVTPHTPIEGTLPTDVSKVDENNTPTIAATTSEGIEEDTTNNDEPVT